MITFLITVFFVVIGVICMIYALAMLLTALYVSYLTNEWIVYAIIGIIFGILSFWSLKAAYKIYDQRPAIEIKFNK